MTQRRWRNQPVHRVPDSQGARSLWRFVFALVVACAPTGVYLVQQNECVQLNYELDALRAGRAQLAKDERRLRIDRARLESLSDIENWAIGQRGLRRPAPDRVVVVREASSEPVELMARAPVRSDKRAVR